MKELPKITPIQHALGFAEGLRYMVSDLVMILRHRCKYEREHVMNWQRRAWYTIKALLCTVLASLTPDRQFNNPDDVFAPDDFIVVAITDSGGWFDGEYSGNWWLELRVGGGYLRNWWIYEVDESSP